MNSQTNANMGHLLAGLAIVITLALGVSGLIYDSYSSGQTTQNVQIEKLEKKAERSIEAVHKADVCLTAIQVDIDHIKKSLDESKKVQEKILDKLDKTR